MKHILKLIGNIQGVPVKCSKYKIYFLNVMTWILTENVDRLFNHNSCFELMCDVAKWPLFFSKYQPFFNTYFLTAGFCLFKLGWRPSLNQCKRD